MSATASAAPDRRARSFSPRRACAFVLALLLAAPALAQYAPLPTVWIEFGPHRIQAEVAADDASRQRGLMGRTHLAEDAGMLFLFPHEAIHCMWMKNTPLPLAVAFLDAEGRIINIAQMQPNDETPHCAVRPARYALELKRDGFARRGIVAGDRMHILTPLPPAR